MASRTVSECGEKKPKKSCKWRECALQHDEGGSFDSIEQVLEHVLREHIPKVWQNEDGEEEVICEWDTCEMGTSRGDLERKTEWMKTHFKTRHAKSAKTFKCVFTDCDVIRGTSQELESHVRLVHLVEKRKTKIAAAVSKESTLPPPSTSHAPPLNRIWKVVDGRVVYETPIRVTKKTVIHYADGPRYMYPAGCSRCSYDSDESELGDDEHWEYVHYSDEEIAFRKIWRPPKVKSLFFKYPPWYDPKNPPITDSEDEEIRKRPKRVKKKNIPRNNEKRKKDGLQEIVNKMISKRLKEEREKWAESELPSNDHQWAGSFWQKYLEERGQETIRELSEPPSDYKEDPYDDDEMPILTAEDVNNNDAMFPDSETEPDLLLKAPILVAEGMVKVKKAKKHKVAPILAPSLTPKMVKVETKIKDLDEALKLPPELEKSQKAPEKLMKVETKFKDLKEAPSLAPELVKVETKIIAPKLAPKLAPKPQNPQKEHPKSLKRPSRSCRNNLSFYEIDEAIEVFEEVLEEVPTPKRARGRPRKPEKHERLSDSLDGPEDEKIEDFKRSERPIKPKRPKKLTDPLDDLEGKPEKPEKPKKPSPSTPKRPSRACRVLGSLEEVPFHLEINVEFDRVKCEFCPQYIDVFLI